MYCMDEKLPVDAKKEVAKEAEHMSEPDLDIDELDIDLKFKSDALGFRSNGRVMTPDQSSIKDGYREIRLALVMGGGTAKPEDTQAKREEILQKRKDRIPTPEKMAAVAKGTGTHLVKLVSTKADMKATGVVLRHTPNRGNSVGGLYPTVNSADIPTAKLLHRPMEIEGFEARSLADHILQPDDVTDILFQAFASVFGEDCLIAARDALREDPVEVSILPTRNFPIVFAPYSSGIDIQITPMSPASLMDDMQDFYFKRSAIFGDAKKKQDAEKKKAGWDENTPLPPLPKLGDWTEQHLSYQPQNISGKTPAKRRRLMARFPDAMSNYTAQMWRMAKSGKFPNIDDHQLEDYMLEYVKRIDRREKYENADMKRGLDWHGQRLAAMAFDFIADVLTEYKEFLEENDIPDAKDPDVPPVRDLIFRSRYWGEKKAPAVRNALASVHFSKTLKLKGGEV